MIKVENLEVWGFEHAVRGMRMPMNSLDKIDSMYGMWKNAEGPGYFKMYEIGDNDMELMRKLYKAGPEHRKYLRQIFVSMDITTNQTIWSQFDTYKVGVTKNSASKMHRIHAKEFSPDDFSHEGIDSVGGYALEHFTETLVILEKLRNDFNMTKDKRYWRALIDLLPMGYNLKATVTMNYENVINIIHQRSGHKMEEWMDFVEFLKYLPYIREITS